MLLEKLQKRIAANEMRTRKVRTTAQSIQVTVDEKDVINFSSNDYLGLANHPTIKQAAIDAINQYGVGSGASQMICGYHVLQQKFEQAIAHFLGFDAALVFSSGYLANIGVLMALGQRNGVMFTDKDNHASLIDGAAASACHVMRYQHNQISDLARRMQTSAAKQKWIVTDGVFSMDGSIADLPAIAQLAKLHHAKVLVDDAHGIGVLGANGRGSLEYSKLDPQDLNCLVGTLGKSFGGSGAFVCGDSDVITCLQQYARTAIYSTAIPPAWMASALIALEIMQKQPEKRRRLFEVIQYFREKAQALALPLLNSITPIQAVMIGDNEKTMCIQAHLLQQGYWLGAIRPPTVAQRSARLRLTLTADHEPWQIEGVIAALDCALQRAGVER